MKKQASVNIAPDLEEPSKKICAAKNWTLTALINEALYHYVRLHNQQELEAKLVQKQLLEA
jgi:hypothetical protein